MNTAAALRASWARGATLESAGQRFPCFNQQWTQQTSKNIYTDASPGGYFPLNSTGRHCRRTFVEDICYRQTASWPQGRSRTHLAPVTQRLNIHLPKQTQFRPMDLVKALHASLIFTVQSMNAINHIIKRKEKRNCLAKSYGIVISWMHSQCLFPLLTPEGILKESKGGFF